MSLYKSGYPGVSDRELALSGARLVTGKIGKGIDPSEANPEVARIVNAVKAAPESIPAEPVVSEARGQLMAGALVAALILILAR